MKKAKPSLFNTLQQTANISSEVNGEIVRSISIDKLLDNPLNRFSMHEDEAFERSLKSIEKDGIWEDIIVTPAQDGYYRIISGHRRKKIAQKIGLNTLPCKVRTYKTELDEARALIGENIHKRSITPIDMAYQLDTLSDVLDRAGMPDSVHERVEQLIEQTGLSRATILRYLDLLRLNETVVSWINQGVLSMTDAYFLAQKNNSIFQDRVIEHVNQLDNSIPIEKRIQTALEIVRQEKKVKKQTVNNKNADVIHAVKKCRNSVHNACTQLNEFYNSSFFDAAQIDDKNKLQKDIDKLTEELNILLATCESLRKTIK